MCHLYHVSIASSTVPSLQKANRELLLAEVKGPQEYVSGN